MVTPRVRLGELLVEAQIITREQLEDALALQKRDGRRIGTLLVEAKLVTETQVTQILSQQLSVPWVSLYHIDFSRQLLNLVSQELAERFCLVPIFVRRVRGLGDTLYVAMDDPSDENAQREVSRFAGLPVRAMIAPPSDIRAALRAYYGSGQDTPSLSAAVSAAESGPAAPPAAEASAEGAMASDTPALASARGAEPPYSARQSEAPDSAPQIEVREVTMPAPRRGGGARMVTLTLLDGTKLNLPSRPAARGKPAVSSPNEPAHGAESDGLTARDLVAALRALSHGADASEILGDKARWEPLFAALLSLLLKKQLIADWEFVEEYRKI
jgi:type IV pilus assembly protein PilB